MRGHWISETRKLNRHWQSGGGSGLKYWDGTGILNPIDCYLAPFYGVFQNGAFLGRTDVSSLTFSATTDNYIEIAEVEDIEVKPYIPRITDNYYDWNSTTQGTQSPLQWIAHEDGCVVRYWEASGNVYHDLQTIPADTDFSATQFSLIKPSYKFYVLRGNHNNIGYSYNVSTVITPLLPSRIAYNFQATIDTSATQVSYMHGLYGLFGQEDQGSTYQYNTTALMTPTMLLYSPNKWGLSYYGTATKFITGGTPPTSPTSQVSWSGVQYPSIWHIGPICGQWRPNNDSDLNGFTNIGSVSFQSQREGGGDYVYAQIMILQGLEKITGTITG